MLKHFYLHCFIQYERLPIPWILLSVDTNNISRYVNMYVESDEGLATRTSLGLNYTGGNVHLS